MTARFAHRTATSAVCFPPHAEHRLYGSGNGLRARTMFNRGDGCLVAASPLTERPVCQVMLAESVEELPGTQIEIRMKNSLMNSMMHHLFHLGCQVPG